MNTQYPHIFAPLTIRGITLKNRIEVAPVSVFDLDTTPERHPSERDMQFFRMRAMGGAAVVTLGDCIVDPSGEDSGLLGSPKILAANVDNLPFLTRIADEIHRYGAIASIELNHAGMLRASEGVQAWGPDYINFDETKTIAPLSDQSASDEPVYRKGEVLYMTEEMIETVVEAFGRAAEQAKTCGFEMAMIHAGHGWLIHQFLSPLTNHRTDRFGGSLENRARLLLMIIDRIRQHCGEDFLIEVRFSGTEYVDGGFTLADGVEFAKLMDGKADLLHVSACNFYYPETECLMVPSMFREEGHNLYLAAEIKKHMKHSYVSSVGAHRDPKKIEGILAAGTVDMIAVCRAVNADPNYVNKLKRHQEEEIRPCLRCNACIANYQTRITKCAVNPTLDRPEDEVFPFLPTTPKKVLIAGGGPAGLEAAVVARGRGHEVILCEKTGSLGGLIRYARKVVFKRETEQYLDYMISKAIRMGVDIRLNTEVTPELVRTIAPDFCIAAVGSKALIPNIPGIEKAHPIMDVYDGKAAVGGTVAIIGGGLAGTEAALELAMQGKRVTLVEMGADVARDANSIHKPDLMMHIQEQGERITILRRTTCNQVTDQGIVCADAEGKELVIPAETVILAAGMVPLREEALSLDVADGDFRMIGDCKRPRQILEAVREGYDAAMEV